MAINPRLMKAYLNHFLPRDVIGPVLIVFSLEGVIDGIFSLYVPHEYATFGWGVIFALSVVLITYWGTVDEQAIEELQDQIEQIQEEES